jgi:hypothetical protein
MYKTNHIDFTESKLILPSSKVLGKYMKERSTIEANYDFLNCRITSNGLICEGVFTVPETSNDYEVRIIYSHPKHPEVFVINPKIEYKAKLHMYKNGSLCLYYPKDNSYTSKSMLYDTIIPWTSEWLIFYELYKRNGKWLGKYKHH